MKLANLLLAITFAAVSSAAAVDSEPLKERDCTPRE